jgi:hypothetical protein
VSVVEGEERELTLQAPASSRLHGRVREGGEPLAGATVRLEPRREEGERRAANPFGGGSGSATLPEQTVEVRAGDTASAHFEVP